jgi:hypothetical protein
MKTKSYLALKGVNKDGCSAFIRHPKLKTCYTLGKRVNCVHPKFPFYLATADEICGGDHSRISIHTHYDHILLVSVLAKDLRFSLPYHYGSSSDTFSKLIKNITMDNQFIGAASLRPLEVLSGGCDIKDQLKYFATKYHQKVLTRQLAKELDSPSSLRQSV